MIHSPQNLKAEQEIARLRCISERQSVMLAQALKEKNDLLNKTDNGFERSRFYEERLQETQEKLRKALDELEEIRKSAKVFFRLGRGIS